MSDFKSLNFLPSMIKAVHQKGYKVQTRSFAHLVDGIDLLCISQTNTVKTASFALPIINRLASQINESVNNFSDGLGFVNTVIFGGVKHTPLQRILKNKFNRILQ